jgi:hypothetical protein
VVVTAPVAFISHSPARVAVPGVAGCVFSFGAVAWMAFMSQSVVSPVTMEAVERLFAAHREWTVIAMTRIKSFVDVAIEATVTVVPGTGADEDTPIEPVGSVVAVGGAIVGCVGEIAIGADGWNSDIDGNLRWGGGDGAE